MNKRVKKLTDELLITFIAMAMVLLFSMTQMVLVAHAQSEPEVDVVEGIGDVITQAGTDAAVNAGGQKSVVQRSTEQIAASTEVQSVIQEQEKQKEEEAKAAKRQEVVDFAMQFIGNPYKLGGISLTDGCDCSGFVYSVYRHFGYDMPRVGFEDRFTRVSFDELQPGDIIYYTGHYTIYIGNGQEISAENESNGIRVRDLSFRYGRRICACRVIV
ncbi:C40 family peptidase [Mobilibacterium timonense]|uniref:C40 family peptidase n=1 Tax=Mobilibacterium timonense TaxID=1871012 RepID=UPI0009844BFF|nr:C40 family peptidase [Mobilibacterium timonense]MBM6990441.1 C40 family peptidase [Mobilibacterium timonense]